MATADLTQLRVKVVSKSSQGSVEWVDDGSVRAIAVCATISQTLKNKQVCYPGKWLGMAHQLKSTFTMNLQKFL